MSTGFLSSRGLFAALIGVSFGVLPLPASAQWGSIRGNNRDVHENRQRETRVEHRGGQEEARHGFDREHEAIAHREHEHNWSGPRERRRFDFGEDRRRSYFWSRIGAGMVFPSLPSGYTHLTVSGTPYYYYQGAYYQQGPSGYVAVMPPLGAAVAALPPGAETVEGAPPGYYYAAGAFYLQQPQGFIVVTPPVGVTVSYLPPGATPAYVRGALYYLANGVYYMPVLEEGITVYVTVRP